MYLLLSILLVLIYSIHYTVPATVQLVDRQEELPFRATVICSLGCVNTNETGCPYALQRPCSQTLLAMPVALEDTLQFPNRWFFENFTVDVMDSTNVTNRLKLAIDAIQDEKSMAVFGFDEDCLKLASIPSIYNKIAMTHQCNTERKELERQSLQKFIQLKAPIKNLALATVRLLENMDWQRVTFLLDRDSDPRIHRYVMDEMKARQIEVHIEFRFEQVARLEMARSVLKSFQTTRVYLAFLNAARYSQLMKLMGGMGLLQTGHFVVVGMLEEVHMRAALREDFSKFGNRQQASVKLMKDDVCTDIGIDCIDLSENFRSFLGVGGVVPPQTPVYREFQKRVIAASQGGRCPPLCEPDAPTETMIDIYDNNYWEETANLYDLFMMYSFVTADQVEIQEDVFEGGTIFENMINRKFTSITGFHMEMDEIGIVSGVQTVFAMYSKNADPDALWPIGFVGYIDEEATEWDFHFWDDFPGMRWVGGKKPTDTPKCGFEGELCLSLSDTIAYYVGGGMGGLVLLLCIGAFFLLRQWKYERELLSMAWKIDRKSLALKPMNQFGFGSLKSMRSGRGSERSVGLSQAERLSSVFNSTTQLQNPLEKAMEGQGIEGLKKPPSQDEEKWLAIEDFGLAAFKGKYVVLKRIYKNYINLTRPVRKELKDMRDTINHENLLPLTGVVHESPHVFLVTDVCTRGPLRDLLEAEEVKLDEIFINSIIFDIVKGLSYLHDSVVGAHGRLKSTNCLVDARWSVRLSSYGLRECRLGEEQEELGQLGSYILERVKDGTGEPFRPDLAIVEAAPEVAKRAMVQCWQEDPDKRPHIETVKRDLKPLTKGLKPDIMDNMIALMEKHTNNLEQLVAVRSDELETERKKTEYILLQMLPKPVAEQLKRGQTVEPESYEMVSIYFSDIVGFTSLSSQSTPFEVIALLNDLYTCFDTIVGNYDVYKVETIGDAYMVVSGVPERNGDHHAGEIASLSMNLLNAIKSFKIRHRVDETLRLRIGLHSGPAVAGVVGIAMPRYCLFGDTVILGAQMESKGEAMKIHVSDICRDIMVRLGGYKLEERGRMTIMGKDNQMTYWLVDQDLEYRKERLMRDAEKYPSLAQYAN